MSSFDDDILSLEEDIDSSDQSGALPPSRASKLKIFIGTFVCLGIIAAIGVVVYLLVLKDDDPTPSPTSSPTSVPTNSPTLLPTLAPTLIPTTSNPTLSPTPNEPTFQTKTSQPTFAGTTEFQEEVSAAIAPLYPNSPSPLEDNSSPQSKALTWMNYNNQIKPNQLQRYYIAVLYFAMEGNTWNNKDDWMIDNVPECIWYGVECDEDNDNNSVVVGFKLGLNGVRGQIPREIALLDMLNDITMNSNQISGTIPLVIGQLSKLSFLSLWSNKIEGTIPSDMGNLTNMRSLYLDHNSLRGTIPIEFWNMDVLVDLTLGDNYLEGPIHKNIGQLTSLERLWINDNRFTGSLPNFNDALKLKPNMKFLYMDSNEFSGKITEEFTYYMPNLQDIRFSNNRLEGCIPKSLFNMKNLETLYLDHNLLSCTLYPEMYSGRQLVDLQIQVNRLRGGIPEYDRPSALEIFDVSYNILSSTIPSNLEFLNSTKLLSFSRNNIVGTIPNAIGKSFGRLEVLRLSYNKLSGTIPNDLGELKDIKELLLEYNRLVGSMPEEICRVQGINSAIISADCSGASPPVTCDCCSNCEDTLPSR